MIPQSSTASAPPRSHDRGILCALGPFLLGVGLLLSSFASDSAAKAAEQSEPALEDAQEYKLKAAFLVQFMRYVKWPESRFEKSNSAFVVGVLGQDPFGGELGRYVGMVKGYGEHPTVLRRLNCLKGAEPCHLLFVTRDHPRKLRDVLAAVSRSGVLVIGKENSFAANGGVIKFYWRDEIHIGFEVNVEVAKKQGLDIRSQLLKLARIVKGRR